MKAFLVALFLAAGLLCPCALAQQDESPVQYAFPIYLAEIAETAAIEKAAEVARARNTTAVDMVGEGGVMKVPVQLNGAITLKFVVDSGASSVQISKDVFLTLIRAETIKEGDFLPGATFVLADGSRVKSDKFILRSIKVGESTFSDVEASVGGLEASLLLGQRKRKGLEKPDFLDALRLLTPTL